MLVDLADPGQALHVLSTGQSGHLKSLHCDGQIELFLNGQYHPAWMDRHLLDHHQTAHLILQPNRRTD